MLNNRVSVKFKVLFSLALVVVVIVEYFLKVQGVYGATLLTKREKGRFNRNVRNYCMINDKLSDNTMFSTSGDDESVKISCPQVPGQSILLNLSADGYLRIASDHFIAPDGYCALNGNAKYGKLCPSHSNPLWRKCCGENEIVDATSFKCRQSRIKYRPKVANFSLQSFVLAKGNFSVNKEGISLSVDLQCASGFVTKVYSSDPCLQGSSGIFQLAANGTPLYEASTGVFLRKKLLRSAEHDSYCIDGIFDFSTACDTVVSYNGHTSGNDYDDGGWMMNFDDNNIGNCQNAVMGEVLLLCMEESETLLNEDGDNAGIPKAYIFAALWLSTCPLLVSAAIANSWIIQKNVHGWILTCYLISIFLVNINSVILILDLDEHMQTSQYPMGGCGLLDFTMRFIYFSSLCWMSSMCMNMLRTFSSTVPRVAVEPHRFLLSALFSLGLPFIVVSVSYYVGSMPDDVSLFTGYYKNDGDKYNRTKDSQSCQRSTCALYSYKTLPYYSGPIIFLVLCNVAAFLRTSTTIAALRRQAEAVLHKQTKDHLESFALFAKLFLLTGSIWVIRVVLLVLQIQGLYVTWYGVFLEVVFSIPEVVFPMIIFHHPEFIKWAWRKSPLISRFFLRCSPFCKKDVVFKYRSNSPELQSGYHLTNSMSHNMHYSLNQPQCVNKPRNQKLARVISSAATTSTTGITAAAATYSTQATTL